MFIDRDVLNGTSLFDEGLLVREFLSEVVGYVPTLRVRNGQDQAAFAPEQAREPVCDRGHTDSHTQCEAGEVGAAQPRSDATEQKTDHHTTDPREHHGPNGVPLPAKERHGLPIQRSQCEDVAANGHEGAITE